MANKMLPLWPGPPGNKTEFVLDHDGPASYTTGGETFNASSINLKAFDFVVASGSDNAAHFVNVVYPTKGPRTSVKLQWMLVSTGLEVANATNLSGRFVRLWGIMEA